MSKYKCTVRDETHLGSDVLVGRGAHQGEADQENILDETREEIYIYKNFPALSATCFLGMSQ